ncbi:MAG: hypothetical protein V1888_02195 [archaeon]
MKAMWSLPETTGPGYREVIQKYSNIYTLNQSGDVYLGGTKIAHKPNYGRPITPTSLEITHNLKDPEKLLLTIELARLLEQNKCSDFSETPSRNTLEIIAKNRF